MKKDFVQHVSDTSAWVAYYRAMESERPDALFKDPFARLLVGERVSHIENLESETTKWTRWTVVMRTYIIDQMIKELVSEGVTTFLNLGAGLDSRPYRLHLGPDILWIEADFAHVIESKRKVLQQFEPTCRLESIGIDLSDRTARQSLLSDFASKHTKIAVLTEGVLPYLTEQQVSELSEDLIRHPTFSDWICEYTSEKSYRFLQDPKRMKILKNAPFRFFPEDWNGFFKSRSWKLSEEHFYTEVSEKFGRPTPLPKIFKLLEFIKGKAWAKPYKQMSGFQRWKNDA
jgi:methyltransferase (TIGR00027 family)